MMRTSCSKLVIWPMWRCQFSYTILRHLISSAHDVATVNFTPRTWPICLFTHRCTQRTPTVFFSASENVHELFSDSCLSRLRRSFPLTRAHSNTKVVIAVVECLVFMRLYPATNQLSVKVYKWLYLVRILLQMFSNVNHNVLHNAFMFCLWLSIYFIPHRKTVSSQKNSLF